MSDKLKRTISVTSSFVDGEQPTAAKLSSITAQLDYASNELERVVGDLHDESWPYSSATNTRLTIPWGRSRNAPGALPGAQDRPLAIANLARLIGSSANLNPRFLDEASTIEQSYGMDIHEFALTYVPVDPASVVFTDRDPGVFVNFVDLDKLAADGDYHVSDTGKVHTFKATGGGTVNYEVNSTHWGGGENYSGARFNVIPDPNQVQVGDYALDIGSEDINGKRLITLPLIRAQQSDNDHISTFLFSNDYNRDIRAKLPLVLTENLSSGDIIPDGFLYLRNHTTGEVYRDAVYEYVSETQFRISNADLDTGITNGDTFLVCTVGTDITTSIDDLRNKTTHSHDRQWGEPFVDIHGISGALTDPGLSGGYVPSGIPGNHFPQYLHRDGFRENQGSDDNALRGDLMVGWADGAPGDYWSAQDETRESHKVYFGDKENYIYRDSNGDMVYRATSSVHGGNHRHFFSQRPVVAAHGFKGPVGLNGHAIKMYSSQTLMFFSVTPWQGATGVPHTLTLGENFPTATYEVYGFELMLSDADQDTWSRRQSFALGLDYIAELVKDAGYWKINLYNMTANTINTNHWVRYVIFYK